MKRPLVAALLIASPLLADGCCNACDCEPGPSAALFDVRHKSPGGIGYPRGYSSVDLFYSIDGGPNWHPFIDARAHIFNDGKPAINLGVGSRYLCECSPTALGFNFNWDYREAKHTTFHQLGAGFETLWPYGDIHINGYVPINRHKKSYRTGFKGFKGHTATFFKKYETAMSGGDISISWTFLDCYSCCNSFMVYPSAEPFLLSGKAILGGYYLVGDYGENAGGGFFKLRFDLSRYLRVEGSVSYDNLFKWIGQGELSLRLPLGPCIKRYERTICCCRDQIAIERQLVERPERFEIIATTSHKKKGRARNHVTGELQKFIFVNNLSGSNGTFESPFATLKEAEAASNPGDAIYVFQGDGTSRNMDEGIVLKDNQVIAGSGAPFKATTRFGFVDLSAQTTNRPIISTNFLNTIVAIANSNVVSGLDLRGNGNAIGNATAMAINNLRVENNLASIPIFAFAIDFIGNLEILNNCFTPPAGFIRFLSVTLNGSANINIQNNFQSIGGSGSLILQDSGRIKLFVSHNTLNNIDFQSTVVGFTTDGEIICENNNSFGGGIFFASTSAGNHFYLVRNNFSIGPTDTGRSIRFTLAPGTDRAIVMGNISNENIFIDNGGATFDLKAYKNFVAPTTIPSFEFQTSAGGATFVESPNSALSGFSLINNDASVSTDAGVSFVPFE